MPVKIEKDNSISISGFNEGIGQSVLSDFSDMLGVNLDSNGIVSAGYKFTALTETKTAVNFAIETAGADFFTVSPANTNLHKRAVVLTTTGTLPDPLATGTVYYLWDINSNGQNFRFSENLKDVGSTYINLTDQGTGTHSFTVLSPTTVKDHCFDSNSNLYVLDDDQKLWFFDRTTDEFYLLAGNTSSGSGNGLVYYAGYVLVFGNSKIDALAEINALTDTLTWTLDFVTGTPGQIATFPRKGCSPFVSKYDNAIYFGNGNNGKNFFNLGLLEENVGSTFDPATPATFSYVENVFVGALPYASQLGYVQCINEISDTLIIGTGSNEVYYWDRKSPLPFAKNDLPENNTTSIVVIGSDIIAFNGMNGKVYSINPQDHQEIFSLPEHLFEKDYTSDISYSGDRVRIDYTYATKWLDELLFAVEVNGNVYLMSYNIKTKALIKKNISSLGEDLSSSASTGRIYDIIPIGNNLIVSSKKEGTSDTYSIESWQYGSSNFFHRVYDNDEAYVTTGLVSLGSVYSKATLRIIELSLTRALTTGQSVKIYYRKDDNSSWTLLKTISYTTDGAIKDIKTEAPITDIIDLQIKIVVNGYNSANSTGSTGTTGTSPMLKLLRLRP